MPRSGFDEYVANRSPMLLRFAYLLCGDSYLAEDLVQEVLIKALRHWSSIEAENPDAYLKRSLVNIHLSWRRRRSSSEVATATLQDAATLEAFDDEHAARDDVWSLLARLSPRQRAVLVLRYFEDLDDRRIAELVGSSAAAVRVHAHRRLTALRETFAEQAQQAPSGAGLGETVRRGAARAQLRRRTAGAAVAVVVAIALIILLLLRPSPGVSPVVPSPSGSASDTRSVSPTPTTNVDLVSVQVTVPVFPYQLDFVPGGVGPSYVTMWNGEPTLNFGDPSTLNSSFMGLQIHASSQQNNGNAPETALRSTVTVNGAQATQWVTPNQVGGEFVELEWERGGTWFFASTDGTVSAADLRRVAEGLRDGTTTGTRTRLIARITRIAVPVGYEVRDWEVEGFCVKPHDPQSQDLCIRMSSTDWGLPHTEDLEIDGSPAYLCHDDTSGETCLVVARPDGTFVQVVYSYHSVGDLVVVYHGLTFS